MLSHLQLTCCEMQNGLSISILPFGLTTLHLRRCCSLLIYVVVFIGLSNTDAKEPMDAAGVPWHEAIRQSGNIDFDNDIVPILTKAGCNMGTCHAKAGGGQNGFELSLLGFEPDQDYLQIVTQGRGRRIFPAAPEMSLLLRKATSETPHGGGARLKVESREYR